MTKQLDRRGRALDEAFYSQDAKAERDALRRIESEARGALSEALGIHDDHLLDRLAALGIRAETLAALTLIPLVEVAWADGRMEEKERDATLRGAKTTGLEASSPSYRLLRIWTYERPAPDLVQLWRDLVRELCNELSAEERERFKTNILTRAKDVAEAAGGFLGLGSKVSRVERATLANLEEAFSGASRRR